MFILVTVYIQQFPLIFLFVYVVKMRLSLKLDFQGMPLYLHSYIFHVNRKIGVRLFY